MQSWRIRINTSGTVGAQGRLEHGKDIWTSWTFSLALPKVLKMEMVVKLIRAVLLIELVNVMIVGNADAEETKV